MEKWINGIKTDIKLARRTVKSGWRTYLAVFIAVFLVQMLFGVKKIVLGIMIISFLNHGSFQGKAKDKGNIMNWYKHF